MKDVLRSNFDRHYTTTRAPFGINLQANAWISDPTLRTGIDDFIKDILNLDDVYIVPVKKVRFVKRIKLFFSNKFISFAKLFLILA